MVVAKVTFGSFISETLVPHRSSPDCNFNIFLGGEKTRKNYKKKPFETKPREKIIDPPRRSPWSRTCVHVP